MQAIDTFNRGFEQYMQEHPFKAEPLELYEPIDYILQLGGKRMRPLMLLMSYALFKDDYEKALPAAYAIEIFHNFSLVHDDIMDNAPLRRGKPTVHEKWNTSTGILSGDVMLVYAYEYLLQLENLTRLPEIVKIFNRFAIEVCEGQQMDMNFERCTHVTIEEYLKMIELKTSVLLAGAMKMGGVIADADDKDLHHLYEVGRNIGLAFQIQDDYLDTFGDPAKFGKKVGGDIAQNKKTYLIIKALEIADTDNKTKLQMLMSNNTMQEAEKIQTVTQLLHDLGIPELANNKKLDYQEIAYVHLEAIDVKPKRKVALKAIADYLLNRDM